MLNPFREVNWHPSLAERRRFGWSLAVGFPLMAAALLLAVGFWSGTWHLAASLWLAGCGLALGVLFAAFPLLARPFYLVWYFTACCVGIVLGNTLLAGFYFVIITPVGAAMRAFGRQVVFKKFDRNIQSYWEDVEKRDEVNDYYNQF